MRAASSDYGFFSGCTRRSGASDRAFMPAPGLTGSSDDYVPVVQEGVGAVVDALQISSCGQGGRGIRLQAVERSLRGHHVEGVPTTTPAEPRDGAMGQRSGRDAVQRIPEVGHRCLVASWPRLLGSFLLLVQRPRDRPPSMRSFLPDDGDVNILPAWELLGPVTDHSPSRFLLGGWHG
jgi:hypothetical protein